MKVAIIGCGPSGMFFLHALAHRRKRLEAEGDVEAMAMLPDVTCFERSSTPGGVWKSDRVEETNADGKVNKSTSMYEALWMNGPKECLEFFDYTFDEHFGCALPMYLPRKLFLEYMLARCTKDNPKFFDDVKFNTSVESVTYDEVEEKFVIRTVNHNTMSNPECTLFDMCIWGAGINGKPTMPKSIYEVLASGGFKGMVIHSSEVGPIFDECARGKRILIIGDNFSAEDITFQAIKLGAETIDIISRSGVGIAYQTGSWPGDRVDVHYQYSPVKVTKDGYGVVLSDGTKRITLDNIDTVIFCTGYTPNIDMLDKSLRPNFEGPFFSKYDFPKDWKMSKNALSKEFGDIVLGKVSDIGVVRDSKFVGRLFCRHESAAVDLLILLCTLHPPPFHDRCVPLPAHFKPKDDVFHGHVRKSNSRNRYLGMVVTRPCNGRYTSPFSTTNDRRQPETYARFPRRSLLALL